MKCAVGLAPVAYAPVVGGVSAPVLPPRLATVRLITLRSTAAFAHLVSQAVDAADDCLDLRLLDQGIRVLGQLLDTQLTELLCIVGRGCVREVKRLGKLGVAPVGSDAFAELLGGQRTQRVDLILDGDCEDLDVLEQLGLGCGRAGLIADLRGLFALLIPGLHLIEGRSCIFGCCGPALARFDLCGSRGVVQVVEVLDHELDDVGLITGFIGILAVR